MSDRLLKADPRPPGEASAAPRRGRVLDLVPGLALCGGVTAVSLAVATGEARLFGRAWLEALVVAILIGIAVRTLRAPGERFRAGIEAGAKPVLEVAVALLGLSVSFRALAAVGPGLLFGIAGLVAVAIPVGYGLCRLLGLPRRMSVLVACGNAICGNSAIASVAPAIGAAAEEVAAAIAFTAVLGVAVVLALPALGGALGLSPTRFGTFAGLTVYAVPQVLAATAPLGPVALQVGTLVKLVRVLMLGPVVLVLSLLAGRSRPPGPRGLAKAPAFHRVVPPFILAFLGFATLRSLDLVPEALLPPAAVLADLLTILSMAALGLGVDVRVVARAGLRVTAAVSLSLLALGALSLGLIRGLGLA